MTAATRNRIEAEADPIAFLSAVQRGEPVERAPIKQGDAPTTIIPTLDQSMTAAIVLARKLVPDARERPVTFPLPELKAPADSVAALSAITQAVARGELTPGEGSTIAGIVDTHRRALEMHDLERRIAALEVKGANHA